MNEEKFWKLIQLIDWTKKEDADRLKPLVENLSKEEIEDIYKFEELLTEKLYLLDGRKYAECIGESSYNAGKYFSSDVFLYVRACVVANGREFFYQVLNDPKQMPKDMDFESILYAAKEAFLIKTGKDDWGYEPKILYETYFNRKGWDMGENISILEFLGVNKR